MEKMIRIPLEILKLEDDSYHLLVDVVLNDEIAGKMVVDTGASRTVLDANLSLEIDNSKEIPYTSGIGGAVDVTFATVQSFRLTDFQISDISLALIDLEAVNNAYEKASQQRILGLLGSDLLLKYNAKIDYKLSCLFLEKNNK